MHNKKILLVYYSRSGKTKKAAEYLCSSINCTLEEINDTKDRKGLLGFIKSGRDAIKGNTTSLAALKYNPSDFDLIILATPVWASHLSTPIRTYIKDNKEYLKRVAVFSTQAGSKDNLVFSDISELTGESPITSLTISGKQLKGDGYKRILKEYIKTFQSYL